MIPNNHSAMKVLSVPHHGQSITRTWGIVKRLSQISNARPLNAQTDRCGDARLGGPSCTTTYSRSSGDFLASSVLRRILRVRGIQLPHLVFIRRTKNRSTFTAIAASHFAINGGTASATWARYHSSMMACFFLAGVSGRRQRNIWSSIKSIDGAWEPSINLS
jgi:hypothetical protein